MGSKVAPCIIDAQVLVESCEQLEVACASTPALALTDYVNKLHQSMERLEALLEAYADSDELRA